MFPLKAAVLQKQQEERRKARLLQVREQERGLAHTVRSGVQREREMERATLEAHLREALADAQQRELSELEACYQARVGELGKGHKAALDHLEVSIKWNTASTAASISTTSQSAYFGVPDK